MPLNPAVKTALTPPDLVTGATREELEGPSRLRRGLGTAAGLGEAVFGGALAGVRPAGAEVLARRRREQDRIAAEQQENEATRLQGVKKLTVELFNNALEQMPLDDPARPQLEAEAQKAFDAFGVEGFSPANIQPSGTGVSVPEELKGVLGPVGDKLSARQEKIVGAFNRGVPPGTAADLADGLVRVVTDPVTGESRIVNIREGSGLEAESIDPAQPAQAPQEGRGIAESVEAASGPMAAISKTASRVFGNLVPGVNPRLTDEQRVNQFNQEVKFAFSRNPRFPVAEIERIQNDLLPDVGRVFTDSEFEAQKVPLLRDFLIKNNEADRGILKRGGSSRKGRAEARDRIGTREAILELIGDAGEVGGEDRINELEEKVLNDTATEEELDELIRLTQ